MTIAADRRLQRSVGRWRAAAGNVVCCRDEPDPVQAPAHLWTAAALAAAAAGDAATAMWLARGGPVAPETLLEVWAAIAGLESELDLLQWSRQLLIGDREDKVVLARVGVIRGAMAEARAILADLPDDLDPGADRCGGGDRPVDPDLEILPDEVWLEGPDEPA